MVTYGVCAVICPLEMYHAIETAEGCATTLIAMGIEFLFGEDVSASLCLHQNLFQAA